MSKTYKKVHENKKAAENHAKNIKKRGGKVSQSELKRKTVLEYSFNKKK
ncbi:MAG: hypothetical protein PHT69_02840 [Bacteroidales bacterium]|nr:hypothetical protein [Bacteroidales bacterium]